MALVGFWKYEGEKLFTVYICDWKVPKWEWRNIILQLRSMTFLNTKHVLKSNRILIIAILYSIWTFQNFKSFYLDTSIAKSHK